MITLKTAKYFYREAVDVDLYTGALSEPPMLGAILGPLFTCLITDQFLRIKKGDRYWYERKVGSQKFNRRKCFVRFTYCQRKRFSA